MSVRKWAVRHPGIGVLHYDSEQEAVIAAGTAGEILGEAAVGAAMSEPLTRSEIETLARYNGERSRGLVHDTETAQRMAALQERFDARQAYLTAEINRTQAEIEWIDRTAPPRWLLWALLVVAIGGWTFTFLQWWLR